jgi:hypothetical protein
VKIAQAGFVDVEVTWRGQPFAGASGQRKADKFETEGVNIRARKPWPMFFVSAVSIERCRIASAKSPKDRRST